LKQIFVYSEPPTQSLQIQSISKNATHFLEKINIGWAGMSVQAITLLLAYYNRTRGQHTLSQGQTKGSYPTAALKILKMSFL